VTTKPVNASQEKFNAMLSEALKTDIFYKFLEENLTIEVESGHWTDPNRREVTIRWGKRKITSDSFDVVQKPEYEG
jgi:hypothetical protein